MRIVNLGSRKFSPGKIIETSGALDNITDREFFDLTGRHFSGDWGDLDSDDKQANEDALKHGERILSKFKLLNGESIYIITEHDRSATTLLLTGEY